MFFSHFLNDITSKKTFSTLSLVVLRQGISVGGVSTNKVRKVTHTTGNGSSFIDLIFTQKLNLVTPVGFTLLYIIIATIK